MAKRRIEESKWIQFFGLMAELCDSAAARRAAAIVFGGPESKRERIPQLQPLDEIALKGIRALWIAEYRLAHPRKKDVDIFRPLGIDKRDWYRYQSGKLKESSSIAERLTKKLRTDEDYPPFPRCAPPVMLAHSDVKPKGKRSKWQ